MVSSRGTLGSSELEGPRGPGHFGPPRRVFGQGTDVSLGDESNRPQRPGKPAER